MADNEQLAFEFEQRPTIKGFPELRWTGKRPYKSTQYYPAQLREQYGEPVNGWINKIFWGDNLQVMSHMLKDYRGKVDLIYIDPPFDSKEDYKRKIKIKNTKIDSDSSSFEEKQYGDIWTNDEYLQFMYERLILMRELLKEEGSIYLHCDWHKVHFLRMLMDDVFGSDNFMNEIVWHYRTGNLTYSHFQRKHDSILFYGKNAAKTYFDQQVTKEYYSQIYGPDVTLGMKGPNDFTDKYGDYKISQMDDVWNISSVFTLSDEHNGYPTQKPEALLERIIRASSKPGDLVFDCFMGSGTTQAVAMKTGRRFIGSDINMGAIGITVKRLLNILANINKVSMKVDASRDTYKGDMSDEEYQSRLKLKKLQQDEASQQQFRVDYREGRAFYAAGVETSSKLDFEQIAKVIDFFRTKGMDTSALEQDIKYTGFEVYNVNNYDFFRNPVEARDLLIQALEIQPFPQGNVWDGELDGRMVKIMPVNRIATKADLKELLGNLPFKTYEKRKEENPNQPVERITIVCMGHEADLAAALEEELADYKIDVQVVDILRDKQDLQLKRDSEAEIIREGNRLVIRAFYPMNLMQKLSLQKEFVEDWRQLVDSIMIDWNYDGVVMQPSVADVPGKNEMVKGIYDIPEGSGTIKVKITDLLSESLEVEVH